MRMYREVLYLFRWDLLELTIRDLDSLLVKDLDISGDNSITNCNTRSIKLLVDMRQLDLVVVIEGDDMVLLGLGPLLDGGVSCLLSKQRTLPILQGITSQKYIFVLNITVIMVYYNITCSLAR